MAANGLESLPNALREATEALINAAVAHNEPVADFTYDSLDPTKWAEQEFTLGYSPSSPLYDSQHWSETLKASNSPNVEGLLLVPATVRYEPVVMSDYGGMEDPFGDDGDPAGRSANGDADHEIAQDDDSLPEEPTEIRMYNVGYCAASAALKRDVVVGSLVAEPVAKTFLATAAEFGADEDALRVAARVFGQALAVRCFESDDIVAHELAPLGIERPERPKDTVLLAILLRLQAEQDAASEFTFVTE